MSLKQMLRVKTARNTKTYQNLCNLDVTNHIRAQFSSFRLSVSFGKFQQIRKAYRESTKV